MKNTGMYTFLIHFHSFWAIVVGLSFVASLVLLTRAAFSKASLPKGFFLFLMAATHAQALVGIVLLFVSPITRTAFDHLGAAMKDPILRLYSVEHPLVMLTVAALVTWAYSTLKKQECRFSRKLVNILGWSTVLLASRIPWAQWF